MFVFSELNDERIFIIKTCNQFNVLASSMKSFYSFAKTTENMILGLQITWQHFTVKFRIASSEIATMIESLKNLQNS